jgi:hypothetical protein
MSTADTSRDVQNVLSLAHEVRIKLRDERVIFATIASVSHDESEVVLRLWGRKGLSRVALRDVRTASPVRGMLWRTQRSISDAQAAEEEQDRIP